MFQVNYETAFWGIVSCLGILVGFLWLCLQWAANKHLKTIEKLETSVEFIKLDKVSREELKGLLSNFEKVSLEANHSVRDALVRVHERMDKIYDKMFEPRN
jgi:hypothetical protein